MALAEVRFLDDLAILDGGEASKLHAYLLCSTAELASAARHSAEFPVEYYKAEHLLLAILLTYNGLLAEARMAASLVSAHPDLADNVSMMLDEVRGSHRAAGARGPGGGATATNSFIAVRMGMPTPPSAPPSPPGCSSPPPRWPPPRRPPRPTTRA